MSTLNKRAVIAVVGALALVMTPAVIDLPGTDAGTAFAKKGGGGNGGGKGGGNGGGGGKSGKGGGGGKSGSRGASGSSGGIGLNREGHWNANKGGKKRTASAIGTRTKGNGRSARNTVSGGSTQVASAPARKAPAGSTSHRRSVAEVQEMTATSIAPVERPGKSNHGALASELKGLNAAHASEQAFANASPNSRVGRIAAYRDAVLGAAAAGTALGEAEEALAAFDAAEPEGPSAAEIDEQIAAYRDLGELTPDQQAELDVLREAYDAAVIAEAERTAAREELVAAVDAAATEREASGASIEDLFLAASDGRTLSPEAMEEFHRLLGIQDEAASLEASGEADEADPVVESGTDAPASEDDALTATSAPIVILEQPGSL